MEVLKEGQLMAGEYDNLFFLGVLDKFKNRSNSKVTVFSNFYEN